MTEEEKKIQELQVLTRKASDACREALEKSQWNLKEAENSLIEMNRIALSDSLQCPARARWVTENEASIIEDEPIGYLTHKPSRSEIPVYEKISWFKSLMLRVCFGLVYTKAK